MNGQPHRLTFSRVRKWLLTCLVLVALRAISSPTLSGQEFNERFDDWPLGTSVNGSVIAGFEFSDTPALNTALEQLKPHSRIHVVASTDSKDSLFTEALAEMGAEHVRFVSLTPPGVGKLLSSAFNNCDAVCLYATPSLAEAIIPHLETVRNDVAAFLERGGMFFCVGAAANLAGSTFLLPGEELYRQGLNALPDVVLTKDAVNEDKLLRTLSSMPRMAGIILRPDTLLHLRGRRVTVTGQNSATFVLPAGEYQQQRTQTILPIAKASPDPNDYMVDLTQWRRLAIERTLDRFPPDKPETPNVSNGALVMAGGGKLPKDLMAEFVRFASTDGSPRLVYVPCREAADAGKRHHVIEKWKTMGVADTAVVHTKDRGKANSDAEFLKPLREATGIWFGGGRQWNFSDSYYGTEAHRLMKRVLNRGGVIGGSSAGASIQARYLARATPIQNRQIIAPGYERGGLGFIGGVAIDQHFTQRNRLPDMLELIERYPQLLGIGIDESTALIVQQSRGRVIGEHNVFFFNATRAAEDASTIYLSLPAGSTYDLATRNVAIDRRGKANRNGDGENR